MATNAPETAVAIRQDGSFQPHEVIRIGDYDRSKYNVLIPGAFTSQVTPFLRPVAREYRMDPDPDHGEVYVQEWTRRDGQFVPKFVGINALGLANLANVAGILEVPQASGRVDDGRDPGVCTYRSTMFMRLPDGQPVVRSREMTLELTTLLDEVRDQIEKKGRENKKFGTNKPEPWPLEKVEAKIREESIRTRKFFHRKCETGAKARTHRVMLGIRSKYTPAEISRPFVLAAVVPDVNDPDVRSRMLDQATQVTGMIYGPGGMAGAAPRQLTAGPSADDIAAATAAAPEEKLTPEELAALAGGALLPGEDEGADAGEDEGADAGEDTVEGEAREDDVEEEPTWMRRGKAAAAEPAKAATPKSDFATVLRTAAAEVEDGDALAAGEVLEQFAEIVSGWDEAVVKAGLKNLWDRSAISRPSFGQVTAVIKVHQSLGHDAFERAWLSFVEQAKKAAAA